MSLLLLSPHRFPSPRETVLHQLFQCGSFSRAAVLQELLQQSAFLWGTVLQEQAAPVFCKLLHGLLSTEHSACQEPTRAWPSSMLQIPSGHPHPLCCGLLTWGAVGIRSSTHLHGLWVKIHCCSPIFLLPASCCCTVVFTPFLVSNPRGPPSPGWFSLSQWQVCPGALWSQLCPTREQLLVSSHPGSPCRPLLPRCGHANLRQG